MSTGAEKLEFSGIDYSIFVLMMAFSTLIGVYYGFFAKRKQDNTAEYLLGSKNMKVLPVAISLIATHISSNTILGVPSEMYKHGTQYWVCVFSGVMVTLTLNYIYLPIFHELQSLSVYTYLEKRYDHRIQKMASTCFLIIVVAASPLYVYGPALAFSQASGVNIHYITPIICAVCVFYTTVGGLRAVVWTDTLQFSAMIIAIIVVMVLGTLELGGMSNVFEITEKAGRLIWFDMDPDPYVRSSFWLVGFGLTTLWISSNGVTPECIQRLVAMPTLADARKVVWIFGVGHIFIKLCTVYSGMLIISKYQNCDPVYDGVVEKYDQMFPYYVMDVARSIPGLPGLFIVGVLSAALSSMSSCLNSLSGTVYEDFIKPHFPNATEKQASTTMKLLSLSIGCVCLGLVFIVEKLGGMFSISIAFCSSAYGTLLGLFTMGMLCPAFNTKGAIWGSFVSLSIIGSIVIGAQINIYQGNLRYPTLPFNVEECSRFNETVQERSNSTSHFYVAEADADNSLVPWIFRINYMYYSLLGAIIFTVVGYPVSILTGGTKNLDERLLSPFVRKFYRKKVKTVEQDIAEEMENFNVKMEAFS